MSQWDCVKLVKRYRYREKKPKTFLFSLPRIMVKSLEEELTRQANLEFLAGNPAYIGSGNAPYKKGEYVRKGGPYSQENHYSVIFRVESSGLETIKTHWDDKIHREITIFFSDREAIFGTGLEDQ